MMGSPKNVQRDGRWVDPSAPTTGWAGASARALPNLTMRTTGIVNGDAGSASVDQTTPFTCGAGEQAVFGCIFEPPKIDSVPFRIIASQEPAMANGGAIIIGYVPGTIAQDVVVESPFYIPFQVEYDGLIMIPPQLTTYLDDPIVIGIANWTVLTAAALTAQISVQSLGTRPPQMYYAVA